MNQYIYRTKIGKILIVEENDYIIKVELLKSFTPTNVELQETPLIRRTYLEIEEYLNGKRTNFTISLRPVGTTFQQKVWNELCNIAYGETRSYQDIALAIGAPKACRAVGLANHMNPILILIPCHRVIGKNGKLTGYGAGIDLKEKLLNLEKKYK